MRMKASPLGINYHANFAPSPPIARVTPRVSQTHREVSRPAPHSHAKLEKQLHTYIPQVAQTKQRQPQEHDEEYITMTDVESMRNCRSEPEEKAFRELMLMAQRKIRTALTLGHLDIIWTVPQHHVDLPVYQPIRIARRIKAKLKQNGFYCKHITDGSLYISWRYNKH
jgi:hypothetical protein